MRDFSTLCKKIIIILIIVHKFLNSSVHKPLYYQHTSTIINQSTMLESGDIYIAVRLPCVKQCNIYTESMQKAGETLIGIL